MSHVVSINTELRDLECIKRACKRLAWQFHENQTTYRWYGTWVDDSPVPRQIFGDNEAEYKRVCAMTTNDRIRYMTNFIGHCTHAISVPKCTYQIGLLHINNNYVPVWDSFAGGLNRIMPRKGRDNNPLLQAYAAELTIKHAQQNGHIHTESTLQDGTIKIVIQENY